MYKPPPYPTPDVDPRLTDVTANVKRLRNIVSDKEWNSEDCQLEKQQLSVFLSALKSGKLYLPNF